MAGAVLSVEWRVWRRVVRSVMVYCVICVATTSGLDVIVILISIYIVRSVLSEAGRRNEDKFK